MPPLSPSLLRTHTCPSFNSSRSYSAGDIEADAASPVALRLAWLQTRSWLAVGLAWAVATCGLALLARCKVFPAAVLGAWVLAGNGLAPGWLKALTEAELHVDQAAHEAW
jgi:hypothetical protein